MLETRITLSAAPLIVPMSASISAAAAAGQPPRTTQSCGREFGEVLERIVDGAGHSRFPRQSSLSPQLTAFLTSAQILASSAAVNSVSAKAVGHMAPSSSLASSVKPNVRQEKRTHLD